MLNKLSAMLRRYEMVQPGDTVVCAVSGGADSVALLFAMYLLRQKLEIRVEAAHFNHGLRGAESDRDEEFVRSLCDQFDIALHVGRGQVQPGEKGLEAAARDARYSFFATLSGKIATAHTADDNAETVLMHMVRGTGLKGLGGIAPVRGQLIRPMLLVTRQEVLAFLNEYHLACVQDSSNDTDVFLRNRLRHHVMPLLYRENPKLSENMSAMALRLRQDEEALTVPLSGDSLDVRQTLQLPAAMRSRQLHAFLESNGVREPEKEHIALAESLLRSKNPSAKAAFPGGVCIGRQYGVLKRLPADEAPRQMPLSVPGSVDFGAVRVYAELCDRAANAADAFTVQPVGRLCVRSRLAGDEMRLSGGTKSLKKAFIDRKIPAAQRMQIPVVCDGEGILGVYDLGANLDRIAGSGVLIRFEQIQNYEKESN